jgi:hypothetical protein
LDSEGGVVAFFNTLVGFVGAHPTGVTIALYIASLCIVLPWIILSIWPSGKGRRIVEPDQSLPARAKGFTWSESLAWREKPLSMKEQDVE